METKKEEMTQVEVTMLVEQMLIRLQSAMMLVEQMLIRLQAETMQEEMLVVQTPTHSLEVGEMIQEEVEMTQVVQTPTHSQEVGMTLVVAMQEPLELTMQELLRESQPLTMP